METKCFITCHICGEHRELHKVYGKYMVFQVCTPNNPPGSSIIRDGFMYRSFEMCNLCGESVLSFMDSNKKEVMASA